MVKNLILKVAYDGANYSGMAYQPNKKTIVGVIGAVLAKLGYRKKIWFLSRTDRGVHAVSQIVSLRSADQNIISELNEMLPEDIIVHGYTLSRASKTRELFGNKTYLYVAPFHGEDEERINRIVELIDGEEIDYVALVKSPSRALKVKKSVLNVRVERSGEFLIFHVRGKSFLWQQVRRLVTYIKSYGIGRLSHEEAIKVLEGKIPRRGIAPAPAEGLILWRVENDLRWNNIIREEVIRRLLLAKAKLYATLNYDRWVL